MLAPAAVPTETHGKPFCVDKCFAQKGPTLKFYLGTMASQTQKSQWKRAEKELSADQ